MKRLELSILLSVVLGSLAQAQTGVYINNGVVSTVYPPTPPPVIDATTFINRGYFGITNYDFLINLAPPLPFETLNTLNYTNLGTMVGDSGFRFDFFNSATSRRYPAANFANGVSVADTNASVYGAYYLQVSATNIVNRGSLSVGGGGLLSLQGDNINLTRSRVGAVGNETNSAAGIIDDYWGFATNFLGGFFNASMIYSSPMIVETIFDQFYVNLFQQIALTNGYTAHIQITPVSQTLQYVDVLFLANTNPAITTEVRFDNFVPATKVVEWKSVITNRATGALITNTVYLQDDFDIVIAYRNANPPLNPIVQTFNVAGRFPGMTAATFHPVNYSIYRDYPFFTNLNVVGPNQFDPFIFQGTNFPSFVTNVGYGAVITAEAYRPDPYIAGSTYSNIPGRVEISASKVLDLTRTRIDGPSYLKLQATNHFVGSTNAEIISPVSDIDLATTNSSMTIANLITPTVPRMDGRIDCWTGRWTNANTAGIGSIYTVTVVDSRLDAELPSQINDLKVRVPDLVVSDRLNVLNSIFIDSRSLTITSNAPGSPTPTGELNLLNQDLLWTPSFPRLQTVTNFGTITAGNSIYFGGARQPPWFTGTFDEPYLAFVNHGFISSQGNDTWARYYVSSGTNISGVGPLTVRADQAYITNGAFIAPAFDISITAGSLLLSNQFLHAARSITLSASTLLDDGSLSTPVALITNKNTWSAGDGIRLMALPSQGSLLGTTITNTAFPNANVVNYWAGADRGCVPSGFANNAALGRLILDAGTNSVFTFSTVNGANALYVDALELRNYANIRNSDGDFVALNIDPGMKIYFAHAVADDGTIVSEKLDGRNQGRLCWIGNYHGGFFSSTNIFYSSTGTTNSVNLSLALSCDLDSDNDGVVNCLDPEPVAPSDLLAGGSGSNGTNNNTGGNGGSGVTPVQLAYPGNTAPIGTAYQSFAQVSGTYRGLFYSADNVEIESSGYIAVATTGPAYSGRVLIGGRSYSFSGRFGADGKAVRTVARTGTTSLTIELQMDRAGGNRLLGSVKSGSWTSALRADRAVYNSTSRPFPYRGRFTAVVTPDDSAANSPGGVGYANVTVSSAGSVTWAATLGDTTKVAQQAAVSGRGIWPLYAVANAGKSLLIGWVEVDSSELGGAALSIRAAIPGSKYYAAGFTNASEVVGSRYQVPAAGVRALALADGVGQLTFSGDCLSAPFTKRVRINPNNTVTALDGQLTMSIDKLTGAFWGNAVNPDTGKLLPFQGRLLQEGNFGAGLAWTATRCGGVYLAPAP